MTNFQGRDRTARVTDGTFGSMPEVRTLTARGLRTAEAEGRLPKVNGIGAAILIQMLGLGEPSCVCGVQLAEGRASCGARPCLSAAGPKHTPALVRDRDGFTSRDREILTLLAKGYTYTDAGAALGVSRTTVANAVKQMHEHTGEPARAGLLRRAGIEVSR